MILATRTPAGLGAYPTDSYYDPGRPAWMPYWLDTFTEEAMKFGLYPDVSLKQEYPNPPMPAAPKPPVDLPGNPSSGPGAVAVVDAVIAQRQYDQQAQTWAFFNDVNAKLDAAALERKKESDANWATGLGLVGLGLGLALLLKR